MLDVGQGDAMVLELPGGERLLIDAGRGGDGTFDLGERVGAPFLWQRGVTRLDAAVMTHADPDHAGGFGAILRRFRVTELWREPFAEGGPSPPPGTRERSLVRGERIPTPADQGQGSALGGDVVDPGVPWWAFGILGAGAAAVLITIPFSRRGRPAPRHAWEPM